MSQETRKVLDMLAEGKITAADAEKLLEKLEASSGGDSKQSDAATASAKTGVQRARYLRIQVDEPGRKQINVRMPLAFARAGLSLVGMLPTSVAEKLKDHGIDLGRVRMYTGFGKDENLEALEQLNLDVDKGDGKKVRIFCE